MLPRLGLVAFALAALTYVLAMALLIAVGLIGAVLHVLADIGLNNGLASADHSGARLLGSPPDGSGALDGRISNSLGCLFGFRDNGGAGVPGLLEAGLCSLFYPDCGA